MRWTPASASVSALASASPFPLSLLLFLLFFFVFFFLHLFLPWFGWDPGWILLYLFPLLSVAGLFAFIAGVDFVDPLLHLIEGTMDPLQTCDTEDCAWTTLDDLNCETNWGTGSFILPYSCARFHRVLPNFFTYKTPGSCFEKWFSALLCLGWCFVFLFYGEFLWWFVWWWWLPWLLLEKGRASDAKMRGIGAHGMRLARGLVLNSLLV